MPAASETAMGADTGRPARPTSFVVVGLGDGQLYDYQASLSFAAHETRLRGAALKVVHGCGERRHGVEGTREDRPRIAPDRRLMHAAGRRLARMTGPGVRNFMTNAAAGGIDVLLDEARTADLVVVQRRDLSAVRRIFAGSTSAAVAAQAACPVAIVRSDHHLDQRSGVVLGIDGNGRSANAVEVAFGEAERRNARLIAIHAWTGMPTGAPYGDVAHTRHDLEWAESAAADALDGELNSAAARWPQVSVDRRLVPGSAVDALLEASHDAELLVVARHRVSTRGNWALGTKTSALIEQSGCPVIIASGGTSSCYSAGGQGARRSQVRPH